MKVFITGNKGLLGSKTQDFLEKSYKVKGVDLPEFDITKKQDVIKILENFKPDIIINCAAYTNVDGCEKERELAQSVNAEAVGTLAEYATDNNILLIHYSTDYIFNGNTGLDTINTLPEPLNYYGLTKFIGEYEILKRKNLKFNIIRTNVLYGISGNANFIKWLSNELEKGNKVNIVNDQYSNPCDVEELVSFTKYIIDNKFEGNIFHSGSPEYLNRYDFTLKFCEVMNYDKKLVTAVNSNVFKQIAKRPLKGGLDITETEKITGFRFKSIKESFKNLRKQITGS